MSQIARALFISRKDIESYYGKPPLITWGLLFPAVLLSSFPPCSCSPCTSGIRPHISPWRRASSR